MQDEMKNEMKEERHRGIERLDSGVLSAGDAPLIVGGVYLRESEFHGYDLDRYTVKAIEYRDNGHRVELVATFKAERWTWNVGEEPNAGRWSTSFENAQRPISIAGEDGERYHVVSCDGLGTFTGEMFLCMAYEVMAEPKPYLVEYISDDELQRNAGLTDEIVEGRTEWLTAKDAEFLLHRLENPDEFTHLGWLANAQVSSVCRFPTVERDNHWFEPVWFDEDDTYQGECVWTNPCQNADYYGLPPQVAATFHVGKTYTNDEGHESHRVEVQGQRLVDGGFSVMSSNRHHLKKQVLVSVDGAPSFWTDVHLSLDRKANEFNVELHLAGLLENGGHIIIDALMDEVSE